MCIMIQILYKKKLIKIEKLAHCFIELHVFDYNNHALALNCSILHTIYIVKDLAVSILQN